MKFFSQLVRDYFSDTLGSSIANVTAITVGIIGLQYEVGLHPAFKNVPAGLIAVLLMAAAWVVIYVMLMKIDNRADTYLCSRLRDHQPNGRSVGLALAMACLAALVMINLQLWLGRYEYFLIICESFLIGLVVVKLCVRRPKGSRLNSGIPIALKAQETERQLTLILDKMERTTDAARRHRLADDLVHCLHFGTLTQERVEHFCKRIQERVQNFEAASDWQGAHRIAAAVALAAQVKDVPTMAGWQISKTAGGQFLVAKSDYLAQCAKPGIKSVAEKIGMLSSRVQAQLDVATPEQIQLLIEEIESVLEGLSAEDGESMQAILLQRSLGVAYHRLGDEEKGQALISDSTRRMLFRNAGGTISISVKGR